MFFDTNKIHIQAFVDFINGKLIICQSSSPQNIIWEIYIQNICQKHNSNKTMLDYRPESREIMDFWVLGIQKNDILIFLYQNEANASN